MLSDYHGWIRRHINLVLSFSFGMAFGIGILALAFFSNRIDFAARSLRYGVEITGHPDVNEDLIWLFCGIVIGAAVTCLAWWRDSKAQSAGLEKAHVLNRFFTGSAENDDGKPENPR